MRLFIRKSLRYFLLIFLAMFLLPAGLHGAFYYTNGWEKSWRTADWSSSGTIASAQSTQQAVISVYTARTGRWKGIFAVHSWIVMKRKSENKWHRYEVVGWGTPYRHNAYAPDAFWYGNAPELVGQVVGSKAEQLIDKVETAIAAYPHTNRGDYNVWPGPNSNTFVANILRKVPELDISLPPTAIGKDFIASGDFLTNAGDGLKFSANGLFGVSIGGAEGFEVNILGLVTGVDWRRPALKFPGFGRISL